MSTSQFRDTSYYPMNRSQIDSTTLYTHDILNKIEYKKITITTDNILKQVLHYIPATHLANISVSTLARNKICFTQWYHRNGYKDQICSTSLNKMSHEMQFFH